MALFALDPGAMPAGYGEAVLPLAEVKAHLRVDDDIDDDLIGYMRDAAVDLVERLAMIRLAPRATVPVTSPVPPCNDPIRVGIWPIRTLVSIKGYAADGSDVAGSPADFRIVRDGIRPKPGKSWPTSVDGLDLVLDCGCASAAEGRARFPSLLSAMRMMVAHLYDNRAAVASAGIDGEVPLGVRAAIAMHRIPGL